MQSLTASLVEPLIAYSPIPVQTVAQSGFPFDTTVSALNSAAGTQWSES